MNRFGQCKVKPTYVMSRDLFGRHVMFVKSRKKFYYIPTEKVKRKIAVKRIERELGIRKKI